MHSPKTLSAEAAARTVPVATVAADDAIFDIGPKAASYLASQLLEPGTIVWNGPPGVCEMQPFALGTKVLAYAIADSQAFSLAGGGDTIAAIAAFGVGKQIDYISTGGGAFLEMLEGRQLAAVAALQV